MSKPDLSRYPVARRRRIYLFILLAVACSASTTAIVALQENPRSAMLSGALVSLEYAGGFVMLITNPIPAIGLILPAAIVTTLASTALIALIGSFSLWGRLHGTEARLLELAVLSGVSNLVLLVVSIGYARAVRPWLTVDIFIAGSAVSLAIAGVFYHFM